MEAPPNKGQSKIEKEKQGKGKNHGAVRVVRILGPHVSGARQLCIESGSSLDNTTYKESQEKKPKRKGGDKGLEGGSYLHREAPL